MSIRKTHHGVPRPARPLLEWAGRVLLVLGVLLIVLSAAVRWVALRSREADVQRFEEQAAAVDMPAPRGPELGLGIEPDQALWSPRRAGLYRDALREERRPPIALLRIPSVELVVPVHDGTDEWALTRGAGRIPGTARPGEGGNIAIAGHRDGFFRALKDIQIRDRIELQTRTGRESYIVRSLSIVEPTETDVLLPTATPSVTLVTCYPFYFVGDAPQRFIVLAETADPVPPEVGP